MISRDKALFSFMTGRLFMYSFQTGSSKRKSQKTIRILSIVIFVLAVALIGLTVSYLRASSASRTTSDALMARATNEANEAQTAVYRLTQSIP